MTEKQGFQKLMVWQKAYAFTLDIYKVTQSFPKTEVYGLTSQIRRASVSIPANIAEGRERQHKKEFLQFLYIAKGSLGEVETHLMLAKDLNYINDTVFSTLEEQRKEVGRLLRGLVNSLT